MSRSYTPIVVESLYYQFTQIFNMDCLLLPYLEPSSGNTLVGTLDLSVFSRPGHSQGLLHKQPCNYLIN